MQTQNLSGDDIRFLAQQQDYEVDIMVGQMTTLMQNITDLQNDTDDKVKQLESQNWFKRMTNTLFGKNKATKQEIQKNNDKVVTYISQSVSQLYQMNLINEKVICSLGNRMNEVYAQVTEMYTEQLNMKAQISEIMAIQQQTLETMGAFVTKLNEKIESVDNFHMLISEIQNGMYYDSSKLYNLCSVLSQLDKRQMEDSRKMSLLRDTMEKTGIITDNEVTVLQCLQEIIALPQEKIGLIYLELCNFRNSFPANLFADMIESYHFLSKMEKMSKKKETIIQRVLDKYELDSDAVFSVADIAESFFENKQTSLVSIDNIQIAMDNGSAYSDNEPMTNEKFEKMYEEINLQINPATGDLYSFKERYEKFFPFAKKYADQGLAAAQYEFSVFYRWGVDELDIEQDEDEAEQWLRKASEQKYAKAQNALAKLCYEHEEYREAVRWAKQAVKNADSDDYNTLAEANEILGDCSYYGDGTEENDEQAFEYYQTSYYAMKKNEHLTGCSARKIAERYFDVEDGEQAVKWYEKACEEFHWDCIEYLTKIGEIYYDGEIIRQDYAKAYKYFKKAVEFKPEYECAEEEKMYAQNYLGCMYLYGQHVQEDDYEAVEWFEKSAEQEFAPAQYHLGVCYLNGWGVEQDEYEAVEWLEKASQQDYASADFELGKCYYYGVGTYEDEDYAETLIRSAAENGLEAAQDFLDENF
ncbi:MAG: sel1 repeat family protein [Ruminococcus flavefaciens]|nr:sel1 repeat family protein [Ruminococcus flavefaciens]